MGHRDFYVGQSTITGEPAFVNNGKANHRQIFGGTGSGKTFAVAAGLIEQEAALGDRPIIVFIFKEDDAFVRTLARTARRWKLPFKVFSTNPRKRTRIYNPLLQEHFRKMSPSERVQLVALCLGLVYGNEFGPGFFGAINQEFFRLLFGHALWESFVAARDFSASPTGREKMKMPDRMRDNASHAVVAINHIAEVHAANVTPKIVAPSVWAARMTNEEMCKRPGIYVFASSSLVQATTGETMLRYALINTVAAFDVTEGALPASIYIEEAQKALVPAIGTIFEMARHRGISITFSHQNLGQLKTVDRDYTDTVFANTDAKILLGPYADKPSSDSISRMSGEITRLFYGRDGQGRISERESIVPRIGIEDLNTIANTRGVGIVLQRPGAGLAAYKHPAIVRIPFPTSLEEYEATLLDPWPGEPDETIIAADYKEPEPPPPPTAEERKKKLATRGLF